MTTTTANTNVQIGGFAALHRSADASLAELADQTVGTVHRRQRGSSERTAADISEYEERQRKFCRELIRNKL